MQSLKITISFTSPIAASLQSDTIFGQFCWMYRDMFGEDKLKQALSNFKEKPFIAFSNGFLENHIAMPILKPQKSFGNLEEYEKQKKLKKRSEIKLGDWINSEISLDALKQYIEEDQEFYKSQIFIRNSINRRRNTTEEGLYQTEEIFYKKDTKIDIYAKYNSDIISLDEIKSVFDYIGKFGFGKDKSTGKGRFKIISLKEDIELLKPKDTNAFISLSCGIVDEDCQVLYAKYFTKFGKHGGYGLANPFKKPAVLFKAGSTFKVSKTKDVYGKALELSSFEGHYHSAYIIPVFVRLKE